MSSVKPTCLRQHNASTGVMNKSHQKSSGIKHRKVPLLMKQHHVVQQLGHDHDVQIFKHQNPEISGRPTGF